MSYAGFFKDDPITGKQKTPVSTIGIVSSKNIDKNATKKRVLLHELDPEEFC
jgi:hypothetical protein